MPNSSNSTPQVLPSLADPESARELRAQRVWRLLLVLWVTWNFFAGFLSFRGYSTAATICFAVSIIHLVSLPICRGHKAYRNIMHLSLALSGTGLFFVAVSHPALAVTILFFPISILVASQLLGVSDAFVWFVASLVVILLLFGVSHGFYATAMGRQLDGLVLMLGIAACTFFCCQQGERFYQERTKSLFELSQNLRKKSERLHHLATTDALTGLINRLQFQERLKEAVDFAIEHDERIALFLVDMDGFKEVNDTLGHAVGDAALIEIGSRLQKEFGYRAEIARLGGDEFCITYPGIQDKVKAEVVARRMQVVLTERYSLHKDHFNLGASIGYAFCPDDTQSAEELLAYADTAMFFAKDNLLGNAPYEARMTEVIVERRTTQERLAVALEQDEFFLVYQPQVELWTGKVFGVEALLRWRCDGEIVPPQQFIHHLEQNREIIPVSKWIVGEACRQLAAWQAQGYDIEVSINVSPVQFKDPDFCNSVIASVQEHAVDAAKLDFEITESLLIDDIPEAIAKLKKVKDTGASVSIDDFGTGYSSLAYLRSFPVDRLKIDRAFIKDIPDSDDGVIAASIVVLGKTLGMKVLAEGAATEQHIDFLKQHDCDQYQGYYFSKPVVAKEVESHFHRESDDGETVTRSDKDMVNV